MSRIRLKYVCCVILSLSILACKTAYAAPNLAAQDLAWKNVMIENKKTSVFCITQDSRGLVWLGTNSGLYFYDGVNTHSVGNNDISGSQIYSIIEHKDKLYLGSNNGLLVFDFLTGQLTNSEAGTPSEIRTMLLQDNELWIGGLNGIVRVNLDSNDVDNFTKSLPHKSVYTILKDSRGIIYVGTYNGLARWNAQSKVFKQITPNINTRNYNHLFVNCLLEADDNENIYVGGEGFLCRYVPAENGWTEFVQMQNCNVKCLFQGEHGHILVGTDDGLYDISTDVIKHYRHDSRLKNTLMDNEIWSLYIDKQHNIWVGNDKGFSLASNSNAFRTIGLANIASTGEGNEITSIIHDTNDNLWLGGTNGIIRLSKDAIPHWYRHSADIHSLSHNRIRSILEDDKHNIWLATDRGINKYDGRHDDFTTYYVVDDNDEHPSNWVYTLLDDGDALWVGTFLNGLHYVNKNKFIGDSTIITSDMSINADNDAANNPLNLTLPNNLINDIKKDANGNLWVLLFRDNNVVKYNHDAKSKKEYNIYEIAGGYPTNIELDKANRIWVAYKGGVVVFDNEKYNVIKFPYTNSDETILAMGCIGNDMWISTQSNLWKINGTTFDATLLPIPQKRYTAIYEDVSNHRIYLGGTDEILEVEGNVNDSNVDYKNIKMVLKGEGDGLWNLSNIRIGGNGIELPYGGNINLIVSTLDYTPENVQRFMYKLAESQKDTIEGWIVLPEGANAITFSDLKMGNYTILIKAVGSPYAPIAVPLRVNPPLMLSGWAILIYCLVFLGIIYWMVWYLRKRNIRLLNEKERQTALENVERKLSFLSTISHDLKTPLSMIIGPVSLMKERAKDPDSRKNLETIYDNAVRLNNMIHRTLELQHLEDANDSMLILSTFEVVEFCKGVFEVFKENNPGKSFIFHSSNQQILIEADAVKFESIITNLLSNACKYSNDGATISLGISRQDDKVDIIVSDDGIGIADIDQSLVFQRMFRAPSTSKLREGTGLGLYLIKRYLDLMGGNITLFSKEGQGTSFEVSLPISENVISGNDKNVVPDTDGNPKILIVEDNIQIATFVKEILKEDFTSISTENGRSGLAIAASFTPDLMIIDEMMPIMSGLEMVKRIKQNPRLASIPIIMLTAKSDNKTENESIKLGIDVFMTKPFEPSVLLGRINQLLRSRSEIKEQVRIQTITEAEEKPIEAESVNEKYLAKIAKTIEDNISDPDLNVNMLCEKSGIPNKQLYRLIKKYMGVAPLDYIRNVRLQKAAVLLSQHRFTVAEITYMVGFKTPSYFAKCFQAQYGVKPSQYQSDDETIEKNSD